MQGLLLFNYFLCFIICALEVLLPLLHLCSGNTM